MQEELRRVLVITPALASKELAFLAEQVPEFGIPGHAQVDHTFIDVGTGSIENYIDDALVTPGILIKALEAEKAGYDGIVINCMCDPGVHAVREAVSIPVTGTAEPAMHVAAILGQRFAFIDVLETSRTMVGDQVARYGLEARFGAFRAVNIPVLEIGKAKHSAIRKLVTAALDVVTKDHVDVIVLGCGAFLGCDIVIRSKFFERFNEALSDRGRERGTSPVPVIDPLPVAINTMIAIVRSGLCHSKRAYPTPHNEKRLVGYDPLLALLRNYTPSL